MKYTHLKSYTVMKPGSVMRWIALAMIFGWLTACDNDSTEPALIEETPDGLAQASVVATFEENSFLEGITFDRSGTMYLTEITRGEVITVTPNGETSVLATLPMGTSVFLGGKGSMGEITTGPDGNLYVGVNNGVDQAVHGIWQLNPTTKQYSLYAPLPLDVDANGIAFDSRGNLFFANTQGGSIGQIKAGERQAIEWLRDTSFTSPAPGIPGVNGLQIFQNTLYVTVPGRGYVIAVPLLANDTPGPPSIVYESVQGDGFAMDREGNFFITTHPFNTVEKISKDFSKSRVIANLDNGVIGPAAAAFGVLPGDTGNLYVVTDGGFFGFDANRPRGLPSLVKLRIYKN